MKDHRFESWKEFIVKLKFAKDEERQCEAEAMRFESAIPVTAQSHPFIFNAFREIEYDNGMINRLEPARDTYLVPKDYAELLSPIEEGLKRLPEEEFDTFCSGEHSEVEALVAKYSLEKANKLLQDFFDDFCEGD